MINNSLTHIIYSRDILSQAPGVISLFIETQLFINQERQNTVVRYGFESHDEAAVALRSIEVAKALYFESLNSNDKAGRLSLPLPGGPRIYTACNLNAVIGDVGLKARAFQSSNPNETNDKLLSPYKSSVIWQILRAVNSTEVIDGAKDGFLPPDYEARAYEAMYLMRAIGAGKKIGSAVVRQLLDQPMTGPANLPKAVISYEQTNNYSSHFPLHVKATVASSLVD